MPRPNPTQTRELDNVTLRRELKEMLDGDRALDQAELDEILDLSNSGHRITRLRLKLLRHARANLPAGFLLSPQEYGALLAYRTGTGPRPSFALFVSPDGHYGTAYLAADDPDAPRPSSPAPKELDGDPGRYVEPKGRFALAAPDDRWPE